jgi:hypothetical protein
MTIMNNEIRNNAPVSACPGAAWCWPACTWCGVTGAACPGAAWCWPACTWCGVTGAACPGAAWCWPGPGVVWRPASWRAPFAPLLFSPSPGSADWPAAGHRGSHFCKIRSNNYFLSVSRINSQYSKKNPSSFACYGSRKNLNPVVS